MPYQDFVPSKKSKSGGEGKGFTDYLPLTKEQEEKQESPEAKEERELREARVKYKQHPTPKKTDEKTK